MDREGQQRTSTYLIADSFEFVPTSKRTDENGGGKREGKDETNDGEGDSEIPF